MLMPPVRFRRTYLSATATHLWKVTLNLFLRNFFFCTPFCTAFFAAAALVAAALLSASAICTEERCQCNAKRRPSSNGCKPP